MYWSPNFLAVVFKKQEISLQVVCRMQDLASEFSKKIGGYTRTLTAGGGASAPVLGPKPWFHSTFQPWLRPCPDSRLRLVKSCCCCCC